MTLTLGTLVYAIRVHTLSSLRRHIKGANVWIPIVNKVQHGCFSYPIKWQTQ